MLMQINEWLFRTGWESERNRSSRKRSKHHAPPTCACTPL